jgi:transcriptional regulator with XRE-family HTH domain
LRSQRRHIGAMTTDDLLDLVRARRGLRTEGELALALGISRSQLHQHRNQRRPLDADLAWTLAELLNRPPLEVLALIFFEAETDEVKRNRWRDRLVAMQVLHDSPQET